MFGKKIRRFMVRHIIIPVLAAGVLGNMPAQDVSAAEDTNKTITYSTDRRILSTGDSYKVSKSDFEKLLSAGLEVKKGRNSSLMPGEHHGYFYSQLTSNERKIYEAFWSIRDKLCEKKMFAKDTTMI